MACRVPVALAFVLVTVALGSPEAQVPNGTPATPPPARKGGPPLLWAALDRYSGGQFEDGFKQVLLTGFSIADAERWIDAGGRGAAPRRRSAAVVCALEYASMRPYLMLSLIPWGRSQLAIGPAHPVEALWFRASIALAEGHGRWALLNAGVPVQAAGRVASAPLGLLAAAEQRMPNDPYIRMASVVGAEFLTSPAIVGRAARLAARDPGFDRLGGDEPDRTALSTAGEIRALEDAARTAETLLSVEELRAESSVRLGYLSLRLGRTDEALGHLDRLATMPATPTWRYLGHLYTGLTLARLNRVDEAAAAYRAALAVVPRARSATTLLTGLLLTNGRLTEAEEEAGAFLGTPEAGNDPWRSYLLGDFPQLPSLLIRLREAIR